MAVENDGTQSYLKIYEITYGEEVGLEEYDKFIKTLINNVDDNLMYALVSIIKRNYYTTYLVISSRELEELIENIYSISKITDLFKPYIRIRDKTKTKIKDYLLLPLITSKFRKNNNSITIHYNLIRKSTRYPHRELKYDEYQALDHIQNTRQPYIVVGKALNIHPEIRVPLLIEHLYRHVMITGSSGSGKTTTAKKIIKSLIDSNFEGRIIILDWHREYHTLVSNNLPAKHYTPGRPTNTNLSIPPINCNTDLETSIQVIESTLQLTPPQTYVLIKIIEELCKSKNTVTFTDMLRVLDVEKEESITKSETEVIQALYRKLYTITRGQGLFLFSNRNNLRDILTKESNKIIIIDLSTIINTRLRIIYALMVIKTIFEQKSLYTINEPLIVVIEEAHNYTQNNTLLDHIVSESRKYDLGFIIIEQSISNLTNGIIANTTNKILHTTLSPNDLEKLKQILPYNYINVLPYLETGEAVFMGGIFREPLIIKIT